jgi:hypothetical protein
VCLRRINATVVGSWRRRRRPDGFYVEIHSDWPVI